jgi:hypothetical protein
VSSPQRKMRRPRIARLRRLARRFSRPESARRPVLNQLLTLARGRSRRPAPTSPSGPVGVA